MVESDNQAGSNNTPSYSLHPDKVAVGVIVLDKVVLNNVSMRGKIYKIVDNIN